MCVGVCFFDLSVRGVVLAIHAEGAEEEWDFLSAWCAWKVLSALELGW